jgi:SAM-dependent methyltransferase
MELAGFVDRADKFLICGWAMCDDRPAVRPVVQIVQGGQVRWSATPQFPSPQLREARGLPPAKAPQMYGWRLWLPFANGIQPDEPFTVRFARTQIPLTQGKDRTFLLIEGCDQEALSDLRFAPTFFPWYDMVPEGVDFRCTIEQPLALAEPLLKIGEDLLSPSSRADALLGRRAYHFQTIVSRQALRSCSAPFLNVTPLFGGREQRPLMELSIPPGLADAPEGFGPLPGLSNMARVSGPTANLAGYLIGGATTFLQLNLLLERFAGRPITSFPTVVDWGVGCGRVLRQFWEAAPRAGMPAAADQQLIGLDIDEVNVEWCKAHLASRAVIDLLDLDGFALPSGSVDFLYGISVLTHLTEFHQHRWLQEIARVLRPGGIAILTVHGEGIYYRDVAGIMLPFVEKFGFFDGIADPAIGSERDLYYRATYHSRNYIRNEWSRYMDVLGVAPMANAFRQDFVVLRKR